MVPQISLLVVLFDLVDRCPSPPPRRGHPPSYSDRLFLKALVIMVVRGVPTVGGLLAILDQPTLEMQALRARLTEGGRFPSRRTWERRLATLPATLPARIGWLGRELVARLRPWEACGRAAAIDSTVMRAPGWRGGPPGAGSSRHPKRATTSSSADGMPP